MAPTASWAASNGSPNNVISFAQPKSKRAPVSILKVCPSVFLRIVHLRVFELSCYCVILSVQ